MRKEAAARDIGKMFENKFRSRLWRTFDVRGAVYPIMLAQQLYEQSSTVFRD